MSNSHIETLIEKVCRAEQILKSIRETNPPNEMGMKERLIEGLTIFGKILGDGSYEHLIEMIDTLSPEEIKELSQKMDPKDLRQILSASKLKNII
jgi:hypothetical protein